MKRWIPCPFLSLRIPCLINGLNPKRRSDFFFRAQLKQIRDGAAFGCAAHLWNFIDLFHVAAACLDEEHEGIMGAGREEVFNESALIPAHLCFPGRHSDDTATATSLCAKFAFCRPLN